MTFTDRYGLEMTAASEAEVEAHEAMVDGYLMFEKDLVERMARAVAPGPDDTPPMSQIVHGQLMAMSHTAEGVGVAADAARRLGEASLNPREELHCQALAAVAAGDVDGATAAWGTILDTWPTDMTALRFQHFALFNRGDLDEMLRRALAGVEVWGPDSGSDLPHASLLGGMVCFAMEEHGEIAAAEAHGRRAVEADPDDLWAVHAVAHVLEMQGRHREGRDWVSANGAALSRHGSFAGHVWWHLALYLLEEGAHDSALELFDGEVFTPAATEGLTLTNAIALLARVEWAGGDVGERWASLVDGSSMRIGHHSHPFNDCHYAYALERAGRSDLADSLIESMRRWAQSHEDTASEVMTRAGLATASGMQALAAGRPADALSDLARSASDRWCIGGSHAQRDLFAQAQLAAAVTSGSPAAEALVEERLAAKPDSPRNHVWSAQAESGRLDQPDASSPTMTRARHLGWTA